jgi:hypothetical protein
VALHFDLSDRHGRGSRSDDLAYGGNGGRTETECGDSGGTVGAEHVGDAEHPRDDEDGGIDGSVAVRQRWHEHRDASDTRDDGGNGELVGDRRITRLASGHEQADRIDGRHLFADGGARFDRHRPVAVPCEDRFVEALDVVDGIGESGVKSRIDARCCNLVVAHPQTFGTAEIDAVEASRRVEHGVVAVLLHVVDEGDDVAAKGVVDDVAQTTIGDGATHVVAGARPVHATHHRTHTNETSDAMCSCDG